MSCLIGGLRCFRLKAFLGDPRIFYDVSRFFLMCLSFPPQQKQIEKNDVLYMLYVLLVGGLTAAQEAANGSLNREKNN